MWARIVAALIGIWLMAAPAVLSYGAHGASADNERIVGPIAAAIAIISISEVARPLRRVNLLCGLWLLIAPWALGAASAPMVIVNETCCGIALIALSFVRGKVTGEYGGGWRTLLASAPPGGSMGSAGRS